MRRLADHSSVIWMILMWLIDTLKIFCDNLITEEVDVMWSVELVLVGKWKCLLSFLEAYKVA